VTVDPARIAVEPVDACLARDDHVVSALVGAESVACLACTGYWHEAFAAALPGGDAEGYADASLRAWRASGYA
jgi:hypothetical protein